jgi:X-Pro dipeptidyl-peptidase
VWLVTLPWTGSAPCTGSATPTANLVTRGWADPQNHRSLTSGEPLAPDRFYDVTFPLQPDDQVIPVGRQLGLMVFSSDREFTLRPQPGTELTVDLAGTSLELPVVGGPLALGICADPDARETVVVGGVDSGVANAELAGTCTINDHILDTEPWDRHGQFMSHVNDVTSQLRAAGVISGRERGAIVSAAARSRVGR